MAEAHFETLYPANSRFDEIAQIFAFIKAGKSCQLIGLPGVGRTNVSELLIYNTKVRALHAGDNQKWFHFVGVDFSEVRNKPLLEVTKLMFLELVESLHERLMEEEYVFTSQVFKESLSFQDELVLFQGLKKVIDYLAEEKELTIIFLFERFEEYIPMLTSSLFSNLRILRNRAKYRFSVVFSLNRPLEDMVEPTTIADFYEFFLDQKVYLALGNKVITDFRVSYLEKIAQKQIEKHVVEKVLALTNGHGKLTRLCLEVYLQNADDIDEQTLLEKKPMQGALLEIWYSLTPAEQDDLLNNAKKNEVISSTYLHNVFLVKDNTITIPLFANYVTTQLSKQPDQKIVYDETTNSIRKGNDLLSDMLTNSEFRLLKLLLLHEGMIVERNQIIDAVWGNLASTQGVSEQALDQLIFRLRKKIEEEPTNPEHIVTIKGRGIKYQS